MLLTPPSAAGARTIGADLNRPANATFGSGADKVVTSQKLKIRL